MFIFSFFFSILFVGKVAAQRQFSGVGLCLLLLFGVVLRGLGQLVVSGHFVLLFFCLFFFLFFLLESCLGLDALEFLVVLPLELLELFYFLHPFEEKLSFLEDLVAFVLETFILVHHSLSPLFQSLVFALHFFGLPPLLLQPLFGLVPLFLELLPLLNNPQIFLPFPLDFFFVFLQTFLFP